MVGICLLSAAVSSIVGECSTAYRPPARSADDACRRAKPPRILLCSTARMERVAESPHVVVANYGLLQRDFQELRDLTEDAIDAWLVEEAGWTRTPTWLWMREERRQGWRRNSDSSSKRPAMNAARASLLIPRTLADETRVARIPWGAGRSALLPVHSPKRAHRADASPEIGQFDVKGSGAGDPAFGDQKDGLFDVDEALREFFASATVEAALASGGRNGTHWLHVVGVYAVLALHHEREPDPSKAAAKSAEPRTAGLLVRQAIPRTSSDCPGHALCKAELVRAMDRELRQFGMTLAMRFVMNATIEAQAPTFSRLLFADYQQAEGNVLVDLQTFGMLNDELATFPPVLHLLSASRCVKLGHGFEHENLTEACAADMLRLGPDMSRFPRLAQMSFKKSIYLRSGSVILAPDHPNRMHQPALRALGASMSSTPFGTFPFAETPNATFGSHWLHWLDPSWAVRSRGAASWPIHQWERATHKPVIVQTAFAVLQERLHRAYSRRCVAHAGNQTSPESPPSRRLRELSASATGNLRRFDQPDQAAVAYLFLVRDVQTLLRGQFEPMWAEYFAGCDYSGRAQLCACEAEVGDSEAVAQCGSDAIESLSNRYRIAATYFVSCDSVRGKKAVSPSFRQLKNVVASSTVRPTQHGEKSL